MSVTNDDAARLAPNRVLQRLRQEKGWGRTRLAKELERLALTMDRRPPTVSAMEKAIYRHESGRSAVTDPLYRDLYCALYDATPHELFGAVDACSEQTNRFTVASHNFVPVYVGPIDAPSIGRNDAMAGTTCTVFEATLTGAEANVYLFPSWGVAVYHLERDVAYPSLASLALARRRGHGEDQDQVNTHARELFGNEGLSAPYVLSSFWLQQPAWSGNELGTAMRIMSMPRILLDYSETQEDIPEGHAELVEQEVLRSGFEDDRITSFGLTGISLGYASWAGVSYFPLAPRRSLQPEDFVRCEIVVQALWCYCHHIQGVVEDTNGLDTDLHEWRWLRSARSRIANERPRETAQHSAMRTAILDTSGVVKQIDSAIELIRDFGG